MTPEERQLLEWTSKLLAELKAEETAMSSSMGKPKYSPETIEVKAKSLASARKSIHIERNRLQIFTTDGSLTRAN